MMNSISNPFGVSVFGSAIVRVEPDIVSLSFSTSRIGQHPKEAFQQIRDASRQVQQYLTQAKISEFGSSRIHLEEAYRYVGSENQFLGYRASINFQVLLYDLDRVEEILSGIVDAGVNHIRSVDFQTSKLKEIRAEARQRAVAAAKEKAEIYCAASGVELGDVIHIEDISPDVLRGHEGHVRREPQIDDEGATQSFSPGSITVGGAVRVAYEIKN